MRFYNFIVLFFAMGLHAHAETGEALIQPRVIVYRYPTGRFEGIVNWNCPVFAGYWDGRVIWRKQWENSVDALFETRHKSAGDIIGEIESVVTNYNGRTFKLTDSSHPIETELWANGKIMRILGDWQKPSRLEASSEDENDTIAQINEHERKLWLSLPNEIRALLASIVEFDATDKVKWYPEKIIFFLQTPIKTTQLTIPWPNEWPRAFVSIPNTHAAMGAVFHGSMLNELLEKLPDDGRYRAVSLDGETRFPSIRVIFPGVLEVGLEKGL